MIYQISWNNNICKTDLDGNQPHDLDLSPEGSQDISEPLHEPSQEPMANLEGVPG